MNFTSDRPVYRRAFELYGLQGANCNLIQLREGNTGSSGNFVCKCTSMMLRRSPRLLLACEVCYHVSDHLLQK